MNPLNKTITYLKKSARIMLKKPSWQVLQDSVRFFPSWWLHLRPDKNSVKDKMPWLTFGAIRHIEKIIKPEMVVFEYGSGGSTLFWSTKVQKVISVEHDRAWYQRMVDEFSAQKITNVEYILAEAEPDNTFLAKKFTLPQHYLSEDTAYTGKNFEAYVKKIDQYPDACFDVVVVDGRARTSCILHAIKKVKSKGYLIVDNTERGYYLEPFTALLKDWKKWDYAGPVPYNYGFSQTTILQKQ